MRRAFSILVALLALLLAAGCGGGGGGKSSTAGGGGSVPDGADYIPASSAALFYFDTDFDGDVWKSLDDLSKKFPDRDKLLALIKSQLAQQHLSFATDIKPALGPEVDIGAQSFTDEANVVGATEPKDQAKFDALVQKLNASDSSNPAMTKRVGDWTLLSDKASALSAGAAAHNGTSLAESAAFKEAIESLPDAALVKLYVSGQAIRGALAKAGNATGATIPGFGKIDWITAALQANGDGLRIDSHAKSSAATVAPYTPKLVDEVPAGALAYASFANLGKYLRPLLANPVLQDSLAEVERQIGVSPTELAPLLEGEGALYVREGTPIPEVTLVLTQTDEQKALSVLDRIVAKALNGVQPQPTTVDGVTLKRIPLGSDQTLSLYYGAFDGKLVISDSTNSVRGLKEDGTKFADDDDFKSAKDAAGMGDSTLGFLYANIARIVPIVENFASAQGGNIPPEITNNLETLRTALFYGSKDGDTTSVTGFVGVK